MRIRARWDHLTSRGHQRVRLGKAGLSEKAGPSEEGGSSVITGLSEEVVEGEIGSSVVAVSLNKVGGMLEVRKVGLSKRQDLHGVRRH